MIDAEFLKKHLNLEPLPGEGGFFSETYRSRHTISKKSLPSSYAGDRTVSTCIYYLLTRHTFSAMHRLPGDEIFHFYLGDPVKMLQLLPDARGRMIKIGINLENGEVPQVLVPGGVWQGSRLIDGGSYALLGVTMAPGFEFEDYEAGSRRNLIRQFPHYADEIRALTSPG